MLPCSVDPRAKMKVTSLQSPFIKSLEVIGRPRGCTAVITSTGPGWILGTGEAAMEHVRAASARIWSVMLSS